MAFEYCLDCCCELTATDEFCPECGRPTRGFQWTRERLTRMQLVGIGIEFAGFALMLSVAYARFLIDLGGWVVILGMTVFAFSSSESQRRMTLWEIIGIGLVFVGLAFGLGAGEVRYFKNVGFWLYISGVFVAILSARGNKQPHLNTP